MPFSPEARAALLRAKGVGPTVVSRLEQLGYSSFDQLAEADVTDIVSGAAALVGSTCWKNSPQARAAIQAAISVAQASSAATPDPSASDLASRANLGPKSAQALSDAGIHSFAQLQQMGAVAAYARTKRVAKVSLNLLWALEGALTGLHWKVVAREHRTSLLLALDQLESGREPAT